MIRNIGLNVRICQLNIEGISQSKCQYLGKISKEDAVDILLILEAHMENDEQAWSGAKIPANDIIGIIFHGRYGSLVYARKDIETIYLISYAFRSCVAIW